ncbi:hypothetical protein HJC23_004433 [Cyclotella cryptica]|uniref:Uncharacterized protein n=1 Tax=Cyclotella cryptica TaxID=29204 RepID=A0ABD3QEX5_9STRA
MLRRLRSRDSNDDDAHREAIHRAVPFAAAAAHRDMANNNNNNEGEDGEERDPLSQLVQRLRREYATNFGSLLSSSTSSSSHHHASGSFSMRPSDLDRARYFLEATAGNVGLASWLYWEDYLTSNSGAAAAAAATGGGDAWNRPSAAASAPAAASGEFHVHSHLEELKPSTSEGEGAKRKRGDDPTEEPEDKEDDNDAHQDDDQDDNDRKPPSKKSKLSDDESRRHALRTARAKFYTDAATHNHHHRSNNEPTNANDPAPPPPNDDEEAKPHNPPPPPHPQQQPPPNAAASPNVSQHQSKLHLEAPPPAASRRRWLHHPLDQLQQLGHNDAIINNNDNNNVNVPFGQADLNNLEDLLLQYHRQPPPPPPPRHDNNNNNNDEEAQPMAAPWNLLPPGAHPRLSDLLSRWLLQGRPLNEEESRILVQALGEMPVAALGGAAGGAGGGDDDGGGDDGDDEEDDNDEEEYDGSDDNDENPSGGESVASFDWNEPIVNEMEEDAPQRLGRLREQAELLGMREQRDARVRAIGQNVPIVNNRMVQDAPQRLETLERLRAQAERLLLREQRELARLRDLDHNEAIVNMREEDAPQRLERLRAQRERSRLIMNRIQAQRSRWEHYQRFLLRGENENAAAVGGARPWARNDGGASISDDDNDASVPVFREMIENRGGTAKAFVGKRKKDEELDVAADSLFRRENEDDDSSSVISEDSTIDVNEFFNPADKSVHPMDILWARTGGENDDGSDDEEMTTFIPLSWLRTGFVLSECGNGLAVASPSDEEWDIVRRSHPQIIRDGPLKLIKGLFPYHCKGLSALLSVVTAMLYSGASIRGSTVTCDADLIPFDELTPEQRKEEFPKRLVEALSALIFIAAQSMSARCANALAAMDRQHARRRKKHVLTQEEEDEFTLSRLQMQKRVGQCRVCSWEPDTANNDAPIFPQGRDPKDVRVHSSLTNIQDIRSYVKSHLRSFTEPGGCALFLETIARCHGSAYFERMFDSQGKGEKASEDSKVALVGCKCKETLRYLEKRSKDKTLPEGMPDEHDCIRVELLSLLLTGQARSNYQNWNADSLGIGLLRIDKESVVGTRLLRPLKPIWVCLGDFGYSTLVLDRKGFIGNEKSVDVPGKAFTLAHWDCWGGERTTMTVIPYLYDLPSTSDSIPTIISDREDESKRTVTQSIVMKMEEERKRDSGNPWGGSDIYHGSSTTHDVEPITDEELQSIKFHPEDEKFYPKEYRRWRYSFGNDDNWISFYRLRGRQKLIAEMKLAPRICVLVRTRWPLATVRDFSPVNKFPIV